MFKKAERRQVKLKIAMSGPSGSGKTYSALKLATGLGGKIAVIDTENGSASLYSDVFEFDVTELTPPFTAEKYALAIDEAVKAGFQVLVIDSITHAWAGEGGLLEQKEQLDSRGRGNSYTNWASITKKHEFFKSKLLHSNIHIIATMRSKQDYAMVEKDGKQTVKKMGLAPIQRDGMEYEFTTVFDIAMNHEAEASKDRTGIFADKIQKISEATGKEFLNWLGAAKPAIEGPDHSNDSVSDIMNYNPIESLGSYVIPIGKWTNHRLSEIPGRELESYCNSIRASAKQKNKPLEGDGLELITAAEAYIEAIRPENQPPQFDKDEVIPF